MKKKRASKDPYEALCAFYEIAARIEDRDRFKEALRAIVTPEDLQVFFLLPALGGISLSRLRRKAKLPEDELRGTLKRLAGEGLILAYTRKGEPCYERGNPVFLSEQQVRKAAESPARLTFAAYFDSLIEGKASDSVATRTPYYRVLPAEAALIKEEPAGRTIEVNRELDSSLGILPTDIVTEMVRRDGALIGVADCFCRMARRIVGKGGCDYPLETCFGFNELAETLIDSGFMRRIGLDEALEILRRCESLGLVHNVENCGGEIRSLCNCCPCCCLVLRSVMRGETNAGAPSRYVVARDPAACNECGTCVERCPVGAWSVEEGKVVVDTRRCVGCGLCVTSCPTGALRMVLRDKIPRIPSTRTGLYRRLGAEAVFSLAKRKIFRRG